MLFDSINGDTDMTLDYQSPISAEMPLEPERLASNIRSMKNAILEAFEQKSGYVKIKLHPENLGEVSVRLLWKENGLSISMKADNKESHKVLAAGVTDLKGSLEAANIRVNEVNVATHSDWDGKSLQNSGQEMAGNNKQSRQQRETSGEPSEKNIEQWDTDNAADDTASRKKANSLVDLTA
jgi:flagellar hook-length control protein FliK